MMSFHIPATNTEVLYDGLFMDFWDSESKTICEPKLGCYAPEEKSVGIFQLNAIDAKEENRNESESFLCPFYVSPKRSGHLGLNGRNPNCIHKFSIQFDMSKFNVSHLIKRSVALTSQRTDMD